jgi:hypothetical protein
MQVIGDAEYWPTWVTPVGPKDPELQRNTLAAADEA